MAVRDDFGLQADSAGFLIGRKIDLGPERERLMLLRQIKADTSRIAQAVTGVARRQVDTRAQRVARPYMPAANSDRMEAPAARRRQSGEAATPRRDASGRFVGGTAGSSAASSAGSVSASLIRSANRLGEVAGRVRDSMSGALAGAEQVDPSIAATKEAADLISPLTKPFSGLGRMLFRSRTDDIEKAEKKVSVPWYKRIDKTLREIKDRTVRGAGGLLGGAGGILGKLPGAAALGGAAGLAGGLLGRAGKGLGSLSRGLLRRIPLLGGLLAGGSALSSIFGFGDESREERFSNAGGGIGALVGGGIGLLAGPVGAVVGGMLGDVIGTKIGEWMSTVNWSDVGKSITGKWDALTARIDEGWLWIKNRFGGVIDSASAAFSDARKWLADKFEPVKKVADFVSDQTKPVIDQAKAAVRPMFESAMLQGGRLAGMLDKTFRHREAFDGISGGSNLARYGTYTNAEADRIRALKSSGANTSGRMAGGMPADVRSKIIAAARAAGLNPEAMLDIANIESGGNPNAISQTGALGVYQFTGKTATGVGITDRFDVDQNIQGAMKLALQNAEVLRRNGLPITRDSLYMMHQLGPTAAIDLMRGAAEGKNMSQLKQLTQEAAALNVGKGSKTAAEYLSANSQALDARLGKVASGVPSTLAAQSSALSRIQSVPSAPRVAPPTDKQTAQPVPALPKRVASNERKADKPLVIETPLTQNLTDRGLAQAATGGIGMTITGQ